MQDFKLRIDAKQHAKEIEQALGKKLKPDSGKSLKERWKDRRGSANVEYADNPGPEDYIAGANAGTPTHPKHPPSGVPRTGSTIPTPPKKPTRNVQTAEHNSQVTPGLWAYGKNRK